MTGLSRKRAIVLVRGAGAPLYRQIYDHFLTAIGVGQLQPGDRLPSARRLAEEFATARGTVDAAYAMLAGEGYVVARGPAGTVVAPSLAATPRARAKTKARLDRDGEQKQRNGPQPFQIRLPALDAFPRKLWSRLI